MRVYLSVVVVGQVSIGTLHIVIIFILFYFLLGSFFNQVRVVF